MSESQACGCRRHGPNITTECGYHHDQVTGLEEQVKELEAVLVVEKAEGELLFRVADDFRAKVKDLQAKESNPWIMASDPPEENKTVLVRGHQYMDPSKPRYYETAQYAGGTWFGFDHVAEDYRADFGPPDEWQEIAE